MNVEECYRVLGLDMGAPRDEVIAAYRRLIRRWHPDRVALSGSKKAVQDAHRMSQLINEAYNALKDIAPERRPDAFGRRSASKGTERADQSTSANENRERTPKTRNSPPSPKTHNTPYNAPRWESGTSEAKGSSAQTQSESKSQNGPKPHPSFSERTSPETAYPTFAHILSIAVAVTLVLAVLILKLQRPPLNSSPSTSAQHSAAPLEQSRATQNPLTIEEEPSELPTDPKGGVRVTVNYTNAKVDATRRGGREEEIRPITAFKRSAFEWVFSDLNPGVYDIRAHLEGWPEIRRTVMVEANRIIELALEFRGGALLLESDPSNAVVKKSDKEIGRTPLHLADLPPGDYTYTIQHESWPEIQILTKIAEGVERKESVRFPRGRLDVSSSPIGATVLVNGKECGKTPVTIEQMPIGQHLIQLRADDYQTKEVSLTMTDGGNMKIHPMLPSSLRILNPNVALNATWGGPRPAGRNYEIAPNFEPDNVSKPKNGIVRNLDRKQLDAGWLQQKFRYEGTLRSYDAKNGLLEFEEASAEKSKYRVIAQISPEARANREFTNRLHRGAIVEVSGRLSAVEEPRWPSRTIVFELTQAKSIH